MLELTSTQAATLLTIAMLRVRARMLGDAPGHEFHGNQWTSGVQGAKDLGDVTHPLLYHGSQTNKLKEFNDDSLTFMHTNPHAVEEYATGGKTKTPTVYQVRAKTGRTADIQHLVEGAYDPDQAIKEAAGKLREKGFSYMSYDMYDGGRAVVSLKPSADLKIIHKSRLKTAGDVEGHEFHGNQWTQGSGKSVADAKEKSILSSADHIEWEGSLMQNETEAIVNYAGPDGRSEWINRSLRTDDMFGRSQGMREEIAALDSALARSNNEQEQTLYRGIGSPSLAARLKPGAEFVDKAFASTSLNPEHAEFFGHHEGQVTVLQMSTKIGAYISDITGTQTILDKEVNEHEWLLPRNLRYSVESVHEKGNMRIVKVKVAKQ